MQLRGLLVLSPTARCTGHQAAHTHTKLLLARGRDVRCPPARTLAHSHHHSFLKDFGARDWLDRFRVSKDTFLYLCDHLRTRLQRPGLTPEEKLGIALWRLACNAQCPLLREMFGVGRKAVYKCVKEVCQALVTVLKPVYLHPPDRQALRDTARIFNARWGFPHCVGAIAKLCIPLPEHANTGGAQSLVLQAAVDGQGLLWDACASFPGGMDSATILENSHLWALAREGGLLAAPREMFLGDARNYFLLGDTSYPLQDWLLKPYLQGSGLSEQQIRYNRRLERARSVAEIALLRLRARWQCLLVPADCPPGQVPTLVLACCVLHNVCEVHERRFDARWLEDVEMVDSPRAPSPHCLSVPINAYAEQIRDAVCGYFERHAEG
ncbi:uncharacterized protein LOC142485413 isoform X2 [Ascaphus truei]|uniref:uncharacterized protein LOC142485413 isoform X2 n=1 Tax=Ascaphus truei TaxID=8439 RepID=UPI003F5A11F9